MKKVWLLLLVILLIGCEQSIEIDAPEIVEVKIQEESMSSIEKVVFESSTLESFYDELFVRLMNEDPQYIDYLGDLTAYGVEFQKNQLTSCSEEQALYMLAFYDAALEKLSTFDVEDVQTKNLEWFLNIEKQGLWYRRQSFFLSSIIGEHRDLHSLLLDKHLIETKKDAEDWIQRVILSQSMMAEWIERYNSEVEQGYLMNPYVLSESIAQIRSYYKPKAEYTDIFISFKEKINALALSDEEKEQLISEAEVAINDYYLPGFESVKKALGATRSASTDVSGVWSLPDGENYYQFALKKHTTTTMTPEDIHQLGLKEVERIQAEMQQAFDDLGYEGTLKENLDQLYAESKRFHGEEAMDEYVRVSNEMFDDLSAFFYEEDMPISRPNIKVSSGGNYYVTPSIDGKRPGVYYLDLNGGHYDFTINTLAFHETVPGHHLEREHELVLEHIPMVRKLAFNTAFIEGWALYSEMLADENGYNPTPAHRIGYLKSELHRAARLVVDTGIHYKKWSREESIDYLVAEGLLNSGYAEVEVTRYTAWPGQACAYKIGQLKFLELRNYVEDKQGDDFDIRAFHHLILNQGSMPLELLEAYVKSNIQ